MPSAPRWYFTSPVPPSASAATTSIVRSPSNSRRICSYGSPTVCARTLSRPRCAIPSTTSRDAGGGARARASRRASGSARRGPRARTASGRGTSGADSAPSPRPRRAACRAGAARRARAACGSATTRSPCAARRAARGRDVLDLVGHRAAVGLLQPRQRLGERLAADVDAEHRGAGSRACSSGVSLRLEPQRVERGIADGLRAERVEPRREVTVHAVGLDERHRRGDAAEQLGVGRRCVRAGALERRGRRDAAAWPFPAPAVAAAATRAGARAREARRRSSPSPLSKSARHSGGTASGFSRYSSRSRRA